MKREVPSGVFAAGARSEQDGRRQQRAAGQRDQWSPHKKLPGGDPSDNARDPTVRQLEANRRAPVQDLRAIAAGIDQVRPECRLLRPRPATESTVSAVTATTDVARNGGVRETKLLEPTLEDRLRSVPGALVGVDVEPGFDRVVMRIQVIVDAERTPLLTNRRRQAERRAPVDHG